MAEDQKTIPLERQSGANLTALKKMLREDKDTYLANKARITELNADNAVIRKRAIANGIPAKAFTHEMARAEMEADKRDEYDFGRQVSAEAFGHPMADLFENLDDKQDQNPQSAPKATTAKVAAAKSDKPKAAKKPAAKKPAVAKAPKEPKVAKAPKPKPGESRPLTGLEDALKDADTSKAN